MNYVDEKIVLDFYIDQIEKDNINFLQNRDTFKEAIIKEVTNLKNAEVMHDKIEVAKKLWKLLFEASMSYIDPDKRGYDVLFGYFDEYVNFEELIFASDSFYRDHTIHCLWVYFLGEYIKRNKEYNGLFSSEEEQRNGNLKMLYLMENTSIKDIIPEMYNFFKSHIAILSQEEAIRCVAALTHDLGYPLKKIYKINKSISKILPFFSINNYNEFNFEFSNVQEGFINSFIDLLDIDLSMALSAGSDKIDERMKMDELFGKIFIMDDKGVNAIAFNEEVINQLSEEEKSLLRYASVKRIRLYHDVPRKMRYSNDFEEYQHGIMSAFLLAKTIKAFTNSKLSYSEISDMEASRIDFAKINSKVAILDAVADHTSSGYQITAIDNVSSFLILIDELEEFSRISRANQNRQFINEFCKTELFYENGVLNVNFIFDNTNIPNLDPERAFKGRCERLLTLFNIKDMDENLKIILRCIGKLPYDNKTYSIEIRRKYASITIDGMEQNIPGYIKSSQFYTREEYESL